MNSSPGDPAPTPRSPTTPLGLVRPPAAHEMTPEEYAKSVDWNGVADTREFRALLKAKAGFIVPACIFFMVYYFALLISVGYAPHFMEKKVIGVVNLAYLFALSQFFMAWIIAALYVKAAARHDEMATKVTRGIRSTLP